MTAISFRGVRWGVVGAVDIDVPVQPLLNTPHAYQYKFINTTKNVVTNPSVTVQATNGTASITYTSCNTRIPAGASCTVTGQYTPTSLNGTVTATLEYEGGSASAGSGTGSKIIGYLEGWNPGPTPASILAAGYTNAIIGFAVFSLSNPGTLVLATSGIEPGYIQALQSQGIPVSISIGGAGTSIAGTTVSLDEAVQAASSQQAFEDAMVQSLNDLVQNQGYNGIDIDIEQGFTVTSPFASSSGNVQILTNILTRFRTANPTAYISMAPQTPNVSPVPGYAYNNTFSNYSGLIENTYSIINWVAIQNYNQGSTYGIDCNLYETNNLTFNPDAAVADAVDTLASWPSQCPGGQASGFNPYTGPLVGSQVAMGFAAPNGSGVSDGSPAAVPSVINRAVQCLRTEVIAPNSCETYAYTTAYPTAGSVMFWDINYDAANGFATATGVYNCVVNGSC
jgi:chitinase